MSPQPTISTKQPGEPNKLLAMQFHRFFPYVVAGIALAYALGLIVKETWTQESWEQGLVSIVLTLLLARHTHIALKKHGATNEEEQNGLPKRTALATFLSWLFLLFSLGLASPFSHPELRPLSFTSLLCAVLTFTVGIRPVGNLFPLLFWCTAFLPLRDEILLFLSYPFRLMATILSTQFLRLCGIQIINHSTTMELPAQGQSIAITYACSGIQQLDVFLVLAFLTVCTMHSKNSWRLLHFCFVPPMIILANTIRLIVTVILLLLIGQDILKPQIHTAMGFFQIVMALLLFYALGRFIIHLTSTPRQEVPSCD